MSDATTERHVDCQWCGKREKLHWHPSCEQFLLDANLCFSCGFWLEKIMWAANDRTDNGRRVARIHGNHYVIEPDTQRGFQGFGGRKMVIKFHDGTEVVSHNVWHQGTIPEHLLDALPDNATWGQG